MFRSSTILLLYTTTVEVDVCCGKRVKKNLRKGELVCVWGAVGKEEGLVAYLTPTTRPSRRTKSKQKASCFFSFFLSFSLYAKRVRSFPLSDSFFFLTLFSYSLVKLPPFFFFLFLLFTHVSTRLITVVTGYS